MDMRTTRHDATDLALVRAVQDGLPLSPHPYARVAERVGISEAEVLARLRRLSETGDIRRLGVVVRHRELGYCANAMVVWDVPDQQVAEVGRLLGRQPRVNLCYRRPRRLPEWRFNLFCMIHGHARQEVLEHLAELIRSCGLEQLPHQVLFSRRRFKQCGARYGQAAPRKSRRLSATRREMAG